MENTSLTNTQNRTKVFHQGVLDNLQYWQNWVENKITDVTAIDLERDNIVRAIIFAFDLDEAAWSRTCKLVEAFSPYMERRGYWDAWGEILGRGYQTSKKLGDLQCEVGLATLLARLSFQQSHFKEAISYYRRTIRISRKIGDHFNEARSCTNLGYHYIERGLWYRAKVLCCHALKLFEDLDNNHGRAHTENHLGILYIKQHNWALAQHHLERACSVWQAMGDNHGLMRGYLNLGALFHDREQPPKSLIYLEKALHLAELTGDETTLGTIYLDMGLVLTSSGNLAEAEASVRRAETIFQKYINTTELARTWDALAAIYFHQGKCSEAISLSENSLEMWRHLKNVEDEINTLKNLIEYELTRGNRPGAVNRLEEVEQLIGPNQEDSFYRHHQSHLKEIQRNLIK